MNIITNKHFLKHKQTTNWDTNYKEYYFMDKQKLTGRRHESAKRHATKNKAIRKKKHADILWFLPSFFPQEEPPQYQNLPPYNLVYDKHTYP